jgi:branched-chain amino acid transport system substrate-binding protein
MGSLKSLTGVNVLTAQEQQWAEQQAVKDINAAGGVMYQGKKIPIRLVYEDDQSTADGGASAMQKLIQVDKVDLVLSTNITPINEAAATVADKYGIYFAINTSWTDFIRKDAFKNTTDMFFSTTSAAQTPFLIWNSFPADQRPKKPAVLTEDNPDGQGFGAGFQAQAPALGYTLASYDAYTPGTKDYSSNILKLKNAGVDALLWLGSPPDGITLIQQIKAQNLNLIYTHGFKGMWPVEFPKALGADANYCIHDGFWSASLGYPGAKQLSDQYVAAHNGSDSVSIGLTYASVQVVSMAIANANSLDGLTLRNAVAGHSFKGTTMGDVTFDAAGICETPSVALQWWNGVRQPVWPASSSWTLKWAPPWNQR